MVLFFKKKNKKGIKQSMEKKINWAIYVEMNLYACTPGNKDKLKGKWRWCGMRKPVALFCRRVR